MTSYFSIGFRHIAGLAGFDHLLFIIVLCAAYAWKDWRKILGLLTGFTIGHSLTLALTALRIVVFPQAWIEFLIALTILATSLGNVIWPGTRKLWPAILTAVLFGLIHGCGFAGYFAMMLGDEASILCPLFAFNLGLEAGQVFIVTLFYGLFYLLGKYKTIPQMSWTIFVSGAGAGLAIKLMLEMISKVH